jgi:ATP-dependent Clp protease ATP-binding subunit ClpC
MGTEHILLGLVRETEGVAVRVLSQLGVEASQVRSQVEFIIGHGDKPAQGEFGLTRGAKRVVELAVDEIRRMDHSYIGIEHLLIGLLRQGEGVAAGILESLGVKLEEVRAATKRVVSNGTESDSQGPPDGASTRLVGTAQPGGSLQEFSQRFTSIDDRLAALENTLNSRFDALESRIAKLEQLLQSG